MSAILGKERAGKSPRIKAYVTQELIDTAVRRDSGHCMVADAVLAAVPHAKFVRADLATIRFSDLRPGKRYVYLTPQIVQLAIIKFDQGEDLQPFEVRLAGAAQILATGNALRERRGVKPRQSLVPNPQNPASGSPVKLEGKALPQGILAGDATRQPSQRRPPKPAEDGHSIKVGLRREFGLRQIAR